MQPSQPSQPPPPQQWGPPSPPAYPYPPGYYPPPRSDSGKIVLIIVAVVVIGVLVTVVLAAVLYVMAGTLITGPGPGGPQLIGISRADTSTHWVLRVDSVPDRHALTTTTFQMRWSANSTIVNPPGLATLNALKTPSGGVQFLPVTSSATNLEVSSVITISKTSYPSAGNTVTIVDGPNVLWTGTL